LAAAKVQEVRRMNTKRARVLAASIAVVGLLAAYIVGKGSAQMQENQPKMQVNQPMMGPPPPALEIPIITPFVVDGKVNFALTYASTPTMYLYNGDGGLPMEKVSCPPSGQK
jgi:hypothetical protein